ncbi:MAG: leucine-rich repeat protein [Acutalibacteraceae bacterium]|nr:leucine-rich repeat protein [Acutalibacteraceae bacterium]
MKTILKRSFAFLLAAVMLLTVMSVGVFAIAEESNYIEIFAEDMHGVYSGETGKFKFTPDSDSRYYFYTQTIDAATYGIVYNEQGEIIAQQQGSDQSKCVCIGVDLVGGETYYFETDYIDSEETTYFVVGITTLAVSSIYIEPVILTENTGGSFTYDDIGEIITDEYFRYDVLAEMNVIVTMTDGATTKGNGWGFNYNGCYYDFEYYYDDQDYYHQWTKGNEYTVKLSCMGAYAETKAQIVESNIAAISVEPISFYEGTNGYKTNHHDNGEAYEYFYYNWRNKLVVTVTDKDGNTESFDDNHELGQIYECSFYDKQDYYNQWEAGNTYNIEGYIDGVKVTVPVTIKKSPVVSFVVHSVTLIEGMDGYTTQDYDYVLEQYSDNYYKYDIENKSLSYTVTLTDGTTESFTNNGLSYDGEWFPIEVTHNQSFENQWTAGNTYTVTAVMGGVSAQFSCKVEASPVKNIVFKPVSIIENTNGYLSSQYDYETGEIVEYYSYYFWNKFSYEVEFGDGTKKEFTGSGFEYNGQYYHLSFNDNQWQEPWTVGNTYNVELDCFGKQYIVPVTITENPIDRIEVEPFVFTQEDGYESEYYNPETDSWETGYYYPWRESFSYKVIFKDGSETVSYWSTEIDGEYYYPTVSDSQDDTPYIKGNTYIETVTLMGVTGEIKITIAESSVFGDYEYVLQDGKVYITKYNGTETVLNIPDTLNGYPVVSILSINNKNIKEIGIPDSVTALSSKWLMYSDNLEKITYGAGIKTIDNYDLRDYCPKLLFLGVSGKNPYFASIDGIIYDKAFTTMIAIPAAKTSTHSVPSTVIDIEMYINCGYGFSLDLGSSNTGYIYEDGVLMDEDKTVIYDCDPNKTGEYVIPDSVMEIATGAFRDSKLSKVTVHSGITAIEYEAFANCKNLAEIVLPDTIEYIGYRAFAETTALEGIELPKELKLIEGRAFSSSGIKTLKMNDKLEEIWWLAFENTANLKAVALPDSLVYLENSAFKNSGIESVTFGKKLTYIGSSAFAGTSLKSVTIPEQIEYIGYRAFEKCTQLTEVIIENDEVYIEEYAFMNSPITHLTLEEGVTLIGQYAFYGSGLTSLKLPESVTNIEYRLFENSKDLAQIDISDDVESLDGFAFHGTKWYNDMPNGDVYLENCYYGYKGEMAENTEIVIKEGTTLIANYAFSDAKDMNLKKITLPASLTHIGHSAFFSSLNLEEIVIAEGNENFTFEDDVLYDKDGNVIWAKPIKIVEIENFVTQFTAGEDYHFKEDDWYGILFECAGDNMQYYAQYNDVIDRIKAINYDKNKLGPQTVTLDLEGFTYSYDVFVSAPEGMPTCKEIYVKQPPRTTEYDLNQSLRTNGMVLMGVTYEDEEVEITDYTVSGYDASKAGQQNVTVSYYNLEAQFSVTVNPAKVTFTSTTTEEKIEVSVPAEKIEQGAQLVVEKQNVEEIIENITEEITEEITEDNSVIFDISFEKESETVQPSSNVTVSIPVPQHIDGNRCKVFHIGESGYEELEAVYRDGFMIFETTHFSYYGIVEAKGSLLSGNVISFADATAPVKLSLYKDENLVEVITTTDGTYAFENIIEGAYVIKAEKASHISETFTLTVGKQDTVSNLKMWLIGDVDCDDKVTTADMSIFKLCMAGIANDIKSEAADIDKNGIVTTSDLATLKLFLAGAIKL